MIREPLEHLAIWINGLAFRTTDFSPDGLPVIKIAELKAGVTAQTKRTQRKLDDRFRVRAGDLLYSWSGSPDTSLDAFWWEGEDGWLNQHIFRVVPRDHIQKDYLFYLLKALRPNLIEVARNKQTTGLGHVTREDMRRLIVEVPHREDQCRAVEVLSALDDKIASNRRMSETLDELTQAVFAERFLGMRGKSWPEVSLSEICTTQYGYTASATSHPVGPRFLRVMDINKTRWIEWSRVPYCEIDDRAREKYALARGDIVVARMADPGKAAIVEEDVEAVFASYLVRIKSESLPLAHFIYGFLKSRPYTDYVQGASSGSVQRSMNARVITGAKLRLAPAQELDAYFELVEPLRARIAHNTREAQTLAELRDTLLPKLISGEVRLQDAESAVEALL